ncbi:MAG: thioredoxin domain-containing protein [Dehalococcoidia bacterium]
MRRRPSRERRQREPRRSAWRRQLDSFGGLLVVGPAAAAVLAVAALIVLGRPGGGANETPYVPIERLQVNGRVEGAAEAPVRIIEFSDFQCPFCRRFTLETAPALRAEFVETGIASIEYWHFAFLGRESTRAAEAAECAGEQGMFWDYHDVLFLRQGAENAGVFSSANLKRFARELVATGDRSTRGLDTALFDECLDSGRQRGSVELQTAEAGAAGISSTPSFLINGQLLRGAQPIEVWREIIEQLRDGG